MHCGFLDDLATYLFKILTAPQKQDIEKISCTAENQKLFCAQMTIKKSRKQETHNKSSSCSK